MNKPYSIRYYDSIPGEPDSEESCAKRLASPWHAELEDDASPEDVYLLSFRAKAPSACRALTVTFDRAEEAKNPEVPDRYVYYVPVQWSRFVLPVRAAGLRGFALSPEAEILLDGVELENIGPADFAALACRSGQYVTEESRYCPVPAEGIGAGPSIALKKQGDFLYSIGNGCFRISDISDPAHPRVRGDLAGLGESIRQLALCRDGKHVMITSRENGVFIVNTEDPDKPYIRRFYNSLEMATGIDISGDYAYITDRQYGVETVDISDLDAPRFLSVVRSGEAQSCRFAVIRDGEGRERHLLCCGIWGEHAVKLYDVSDPGSGVFLAAVPLDGKGDGASVYEQNGRTYLAAGTGHHSEIHMPENPENLNYGQGNGLEIFDITDPAHPVLQSVSKINGRYYYLENDYWGSTLGRGPDGRMYAYLINTFNGVYVYDITDPRAPRQLAYTDIPLPPTHPGYEYLTDRHCIPVVQYDQKAAGRSPVGGIAAADGCLYMAGVASDIHILRDAELFHAAPAGKVGKKNPEPSDYFARGTEGFRNPLLKVLPGQVFAAVQKDGWIYAACGSGGIAVLDENLEEKARYPFDGSRCAFDVQIEGGILYAAEGSGGLTAYSLDSGKLTPLWNYMPDGGLCRGVRLSAGARFAMLMTDGSTAELVNCRTRQKVWRDRGPHLLYHRNLASLLGGRYLACWRSGRRMCVVDCSGETPVQAAEYMKSRAGVSSGFADLGDASLAIGPSGMTIFRGIPSPEEYQALPWVEGTKDKKIYGWPVTDGRLLICCNRGKGSVCAADITDRAHPVLLEEHTVPGNPDAALLTARYVYIPLGYQGLLRFDRPL